MVNKIVGYVLSVVGLLAIGVTVKPIKEKLAFLAGVNNLYLIVGGVAVLVLGMVLLRGGSGGRQASEVPIYRGKKVVGYRRLRSLFFT